MVNQAEGTQSTHLAAFFNSQTEAVLWQLYVPSLCHMKDIVCSTQACWTGSTVCVRASLQSQCALLHATVLRP